MPLSFIFSLNIVKTTAFLCVFSRSWTMWASAQISGDHFSHNAWLRWLYRPKRRMYPVVSSDGPWFVFRPAPENHEPHQSLFGSGLRPPQKVGLGPVVWSAPGFICVYSHLHGKSGPAWETNPGPFKVDQTVQV